MNEKQKLYIDELAESQGVAFSMAVEQGFDLCSFANMFMLSDARNHMDNGSAYWMTMTPQEISVWCVCVAYGWSFLG